MSSLGFHRRVAPTRLVLRWDLDKTYLKSEFDSLRDMVRIGFEKAEDKIAAPGVAALVRALRETAARAEREIRVYFVSASPPQIGRAIREKLELDGIVYDGIVFKDQLQHLMRGKFRHLREQVGFKLTELLKFRCQEPPDASEYLFGDDWESDSLIYSLYADVAGGRVDSSELGEILAALKVDPPLCAQACELAGQIPTGDPVRRIFINLERRTPPTTFRSFGPRLVPTFNYFQTAACLYEEGALDDGGLVEVARSLHGEAAYSQNRLLNSLADMRRRGHLDRSAAAAVLELIHRGAWTPSAVSGAAPRWRRWWRSLWRSTSWRGRRVPATAVDYRTVVGAASHAEISAR